MLINFLFVIKTYSNPVFKLFAIAITLAAFNMTQPEDLDAQHIFINKSSNDYNAAYQRNYFETYSHLPVNKNLKFRRHFPGFEYKDIVKPKINWTSFTLTTAAIGGVYTGLFSYEQKRRWDAPDVPFYFNNVFEARGIDKANHFYATKAQASLISNLYSLSNVNRNTSILLGIGIALSVQTLVEVKDGRISGGGFDMYDEIANLLGGGWFFAREQSKFLHRFNIRWFYYPSVNRELLPPEPRFTEDYNGPTYWLSMPMGDLIPEFWPRFIVPVAGVSLNNWSVAPKREGYLSYHLSLNPDFKHILSQQTALGKTLTDFLNSFYIPAPAVEVYPNLGFKLIFYGQK